jgi:iduronate 2-sulfatase
MSGYYPHAIKMLGYGSPRPAIGERATWAQHFKNNGYHTARVSKIFHMGVPGGIEKGTDGADDPASWTERFNSAGPEWKAPGDGETLENNADGRKPGPVGGNTFVVVEADGDDLVHSDGKTAAKAVELIKQHKDKPFFLGVGFVRPHVPFVAPRKDYTDFLPYAKMQLPPKLKEDWADIPKAGINYKTSKNMKMDVRRQKKAVGGYYASVAFMDRMVGQVLDGLKETGLDEKTIVIFTSDHGYHLGEHDFWAKVSLHDESAAVPLIIRMPGKKPAVCHSLVELLDLYPTLSNLCGLKVPERLQGKDISKMMTDPAKEVRSAAFSVNGKGFLLREENWAYIAYGKDGQGGEELFDMKQDPKQFTNLAKDPQYGQTLIRFQKQMAAKLKEVLTNDLGLKY